MIVGGVTAQALPERSRPSEPGQHTIDLPLLDTWSAGMAAVGTGVDRADAAPAAVVAAGAVVLGGGLRR